MKREHLKRLSREHYQAEAIIHWTVTILNRNKGWLNSAFYYRFRELITHTMFRYGLACPIYCMMPDHIHMVWIGLYLQCDQLNAMKHFHTRCDESLQRVGFALQDQAYDHVLKEDDRKEANFRQLCEYIARNPERSGLVKTDQFSKYPFTGCLVPGYPELKTFDTDFWDRYDRIISRLRRLGMQQWK
ncbi:hypothetical protein ACMFWY_03020 [Roseiconus sp. JC912]